LTGESSLLLKAPYDSFRARWYQRDASAATEICAEFSGGAQDKFLLAPRSAVRPLRSGPAWQRRAENSCMCTNYSHNGRLPEDFIHGPQYRHGSRVLSVGRSACVWEGEIS